MRLPPLHDVLDPEALCQSILKRVLERNNGYWDPRDREEILNEMRLLILDLAAGYDPSRQTKSKTFSSYVTWILLRRAGVDVYRKRLVDTRYHERRAPELSLDELRERLDSSVSYEESDDTPTREQGDLLTRFACAVSVTDVSPLEALEDWVSRLQPVEAPA